MSKDDFYTELHDDEFRVFLLYYYYKFNFDCKDHLIDEDRSKPFTVHEIREEIKEFNKDDRTDEEFAYVLKKSQYVVFHPQNENLAMSHINAGIVNNIREKILFVQEKILDPRFTTFLCNDVDLDKRRILDKINEIRNNTHYSDREMASNYRDEESYLELILDNFYPLVFYCQACYGKFIF